MSNSYTIASWDGRVSINISKDISNAFVYPSPSTRFRFFTIIPYYNPSLNEEGDVPNGYIADLDNPTGIPQILPWLNSTRIPDYNIKKNYYERWLQILKMGYGWYRFNNMMEFIDMFTMRSYPMRYFPRLANIALGYAEDKPSPATFLLYLLNFIPITVIFVRYNSSSFFNLSIRQQIEAILKNSSFLDDHDIYIELGLAIGELQDPAIQSDYTAAVNNIRSSMISALSNPDFLGVFDAPIFKERDDALYALALLQNLYTAVSLSGWAVLPDSNSIFKDKYRLLPPTAVYTRILNELGTANRMFDSIVNKDFTFIRTLKPIQSKTFNNINRILDNVQNLSLHSNVLAKIGAKLVFLSDVTLYPNRNILRYEPAVRATLHAKRILKIVGAYFLGRTKSQELYEEFVATINSLLRNDTVNMYVWIDPDENLASENVLIVHLNVEVGVAIYRVVVELVAN